MYRKNWENPVTVEVNLDEYIQNKNDGTPNTNWANRPITMITKVAKAQALREAFIEELEGMYEAEETGVDLSNIDNDPVEMSDISEAEEISDEEMKGLFAKDENKNPFE